LEGKMKVDTIMTKDVAFCKGNTRLDEVARMMADYDCSAIPVVEDEKTRRLVGILTDRDIVRRTLAVGKNPAGLTASACMTSEVFVVRDNSEVEDALATMEEHHIRRLPIIDDKRACCGIVTLTNLAAFLPAPTVGEIVKELTEPYQRTNGHKSANPTPGGPSASTKSQKEGNGPLNGDRAPFRSISELPGDVKSLLPKTAQQVYLDAYNSALRELQDPTKPPESPGEIKKSASKIAWGAVKQQYQKKGDEWVAKSPSSRS
jgi:CBS domain-containing protein/cation transport regulator ChaB